VPKLHPIDITVEKQLRDFVLTACVQLQTHITVLFGPSGHGKTTLLNLVAGVMQPDTGRITLGNTVFFDTQQRINIPIEHRNIGYVFQDHALFPHLSVFNNLAYGLKARRCLNIPHQTHSMLKRFSIDHLAHEMPAKLSTGQRQRVALARALVIEPCILLLDEPFSHLDAALKTQVQLELKQILLGLNIPTLMVSHDPQDAIVFADTVLSIHQGEVLIQPPYQRSNGLF
jgi:molybdate transport system ATP-binding protein